ncbi:MAG: hypothetical protein JWM43_3041 [Acidobacteriaceae bacterium]|nr:hypothetical protein [Acidobacteriaceae bacterium]
MVPREPFMRRHTYHRQRQWYESSGYRPILETSILKCTPR